MNRILSELQELRLEVAKLNRAVSSTSLKNEMLTLQQACEYLKISRATMHKRLACGDISFAVKKGKSWLFPLKRLNDYASGY